MSLTDQELDQFLTDVGVFSEEKLETLVDVREKPNLPKPPEAPRPKRIYLLLAIGSAFILGLSIGLLYNQHQTGRQFTYLVNRLNELETPKHLTEQPETAIDPATL